MEQVMDPATEAEAEMAAVAHRALVMALDHSTADHIDLTLDNGDDRPVLKLPPRALKQLALILRTMAKRQPLVLIPQAAELSTQEAAAFLNVSRPFVVKEIEAGKLPCHLVGRHRRITFSDLRAYRDAQKGRSNAALNEIARLSAEAGFDL